MQTDHLKKYDLHGHTKYSHDSNLKPETLVKIAIKRGLTGVAITDHNKIQGAIKAKEFSKGKEIEVIVGEEVKTNLGEILVFNIQEEIPKGDFFDVLDNAREQDAQTALAHPFRNFPFYGGFKGNLKRIMDKVDALEVLNGRSFFWENNTSRNAAARFGFGTTAGSDYHLGFEIGRCKTLVSPDMEIGNAI